MGGNAVKNVFDVLSERHTTFFTAFPVEPGDVVFLGDSITDEGRWAEMFPNLVVHNHGISADRTDHVLMRLDQVTKGQPGMVFLMIGTNDLGTDVTQEVTSILSVIVGRDCRPYPTFCLI